MKRFDALLFDRYFSDFTKLTPEQIKSLVFVKAQTVLPSLDDFDFSKKQRVKLGIDPTGRDIHIGHLCPMMILNIFVKAGHDVTLIIGDFTTKIGDPSGRVAERAILTDEQITENFKTYADQFAKYLDLKKLTLRKNSEWLSKVSLSEFIGIHQQLNLANTLQREDFRNRLEKGGVTNAEILYGSLQGLDSVALNSTIELGGIDQLLNLQAGREIQRIYRQKPQNIICNPLLLGLDGRKMSKSYENYVPLEATTEDKFGKLMSMSDETLLQYYKSFGYLFADEITELELFIKQHPLEAKKQLATYFVSIETGDLTTGEIERAKFAKKFAKKELTAEDFVVVNAEPGEDLLDTLMRSGVFKSKAELKRLRDSGAIKELGNNKYKVGKLNFFEIK